MKLSKSVYTSLFQLFNRKVAIAFPTVKEAEIAYEVLRVDKGPRRSDTTRNLVVNEKSLEA